VSDWTGICIECDGTLQPWDLKCPKCGLRHNTQHPQQAFYLGVRASYDPRKEELVCFVHGVRVTLTWGTITSGDRIEPEYIKATADFIVGNGPVFNVAPPGFVGRTFPGVAKGRIIFGISPDFEPRYHTHGASKETLGRVWTLDLQESMVPLFPDAEVVSDGRTVKVFLLRRSNEEEVIRLAGALASALWRAPLATLKKLPDARYTPPTQPEQVPCVRVSGLTDVSFEPIAVGEELRVRARAPVAANATSPALDMDTTAAAERQALPQSLHGMLRRLGDARLKRVGDALEITWQAPEPSLEQYQAALELFRTLAVDSARPYR